ncbi:MAG: MBL fold metallo-hydrolase [Candidatus Heimdallarchaeota archaeon]
MERKSSSVQLTLLGGVDEVGGNTVLLEDKRYDVKLFIDFGIKIGKYNDVYERGQHPSNIEEMVKVNLLPAEENIPIHNLYLKSLNSKQTTDSVPSNLDGILISHPHKDHYFGLSFINRTIPIYTGVVTKRIIRAFCKSGDKVSDNNFNNLNWHTFRTGEILDIKGMKITPFHVDHSVPAAYGFIIYSSAGPLVYTGDFRRHGPLSNMTEEFLEEVKNHNTVLTKSELDPEQKNLISKGVKILICEGTKISKGIVESEQYVEENLEKIFMNNPFDFILVKYDRIDWDRFRTFSNIAKKYGWKYIINEMDAYFYYLLNRKAIHETMRQPNILMEDHILILKWGSVRNKWQEKIRQIIYSRGKGDRFLEIRDIKHLKIKFLMYITHLRKTLMNNLDFSKRGLFISSSIDPYAEEFFDNTNSIRNQLEPYGIPSYRVHASGHSTPHDIINFIEEINPKILIPIHTEHPKFFQKLFQGSEIKVILPNKNQLIEI